MRRVRYCPIIPILQRYLNASYGGALGMMDYGKMLALTRYPLPRVRIQTLAAVFLYHQRLTEL